MTTYQETAARSSLLVRVRSLLFHQAVSALVAGAGASAVLYALLADHFIAYGNAGFGPGQFLATAVGAGAVLLALGLDVGARRATVSQALRFAAVMGLVGLLTLAFRLYQIENTAFSVVLSSFLLCGFVLHHFLPQKLRLPFFVGLAIASLYAVIGVVHPAAFFGVVGIGLALIGVCHLPAPLWIRVAILTMAAGLLAAARLDILRSGWLAMATPIIASMFMFRLGIYLYDIAHKKGPTDPFHRLAYFFLPPNVAFPFFPVVDFATFGRTYYDEEAVRIYQRGAVWMLRGLAHLIVYRVVNYYLTLSPADIVDPATFLQFIVMNFGLYLKISGLFHLIIGSLLLFGFNLPETHTRFYFSNSFTDFWRRINIYWKDFMQKCVFNPSFMFLKQRGVSVTAGIVLSMFMVFFATWALHAYNWFWLRGTMLLAPQDMMFWGVLALFLVAQTLLDERRKAAGKPDRALLGPRVSLVVRTVCTMLTICNLWALWTSNSLAEWQVLWVRSGLIPALTPQHAHNVLAWVQTGATLTAAFLVIAVTMGASFGVLAQIAPTTAKRRSTKTQSAREFYAPLAVGTAIVAVLAFVQTPATSRLLDARVQKVAEDIGEARLNARDKATLERGYYEGLTNNIAGANFELWNALQSRPHDIPQIREFPGVRTIPSLLFYEFIPMTSGYFNGVRYNINRWGMRDKDYALHKPANTLRIALIGASREVGWGVRYEDRFETLLEKKLNAQYSSESGRHVEILNFSIEGSLPFQRIAILDTKVLQFEPDIVIYAAGPRDTFFEDLTRAVQKKYPIPYEFANRLISKNNIMDHQSDEEINTILEANKVELLEGIYGHFSAVVKQHKAQPVWLYFPNLEKDAKKARISLIKQIARSSGATVMTMDNVFEGRDMNELRLSETDDHPNVEGHRLLSEAIYRQLMEMEAKGQIRLKPAGDQ